MRPQSIAIVGASDDSASIGGAPIANLMAFSTNRPLHLVSRTRAEIAGIACLRSIKEIPIGVDCVMLIVAREQVAEALIECGERGARAAIVFAAGFAETGPDGVRAQAELAAVARRYGMAVAGPNCLGLINFVDGLPLTFGAITPYPVPPSGGIGLIAQSGAMTMALTYAAQAEGLPVSYAVSTGNEADVTLEDYLDFLLEDRSTRVIALLAEQIRRPADFSRLAARARELHKPLVLLLAGRVGAAAEAARSHTGALASDYAVVATVLRAEGVVLVDTLDELIDSAGLLSKFSLPTRPGIGLITDSGSVKTLALDLVETLSAKIGELTDSTIRQLKEDLPEFASTGNPVDITAQGLNRPQLYADAARSVLADENIGSLIVAAMPGSDQQTAEQVNALLPVLSHSEKPIIYVFMGGEHPIPGRHDERVRAAGLPVLRSPERALRCLAHVSASAGIDHDRTVERLSGAVSSPDLDETTWTGSPTTLTEYASKHLLQTAGFAIPRSVFAPSVDELVPLADLLVYPLALKGQAPALLHKTEAGAVVVGIENTLALRTAAQRMGARLEGMFDVEGYLVEEMAAPGLDLILGARRDTGWGVVLLVGFGGVLAEVLSDVVLMPQGPSETTIRASLEQLRGHDLLNDFRGSGVADVDAIVRAVKQLSQFMSEHPAVLDVDVNPLRVFNVGDGVIALDASIVLGATPVLSSPSVAR